MEVTYVSIEQQKTRQNAFVKSLIAYVLLFFTPFEYFARTYASP